MERMIKNTAILGAERKDLSDSPSSFGDFNASSLESESDSFEEVTSSSSSPTSSPDHPLANNDPVLDMSSLIQQLPIKKGLSKHYQGKSQSFTSLANVRSLEDLVKPENPYNKKLKLKACRRSYGGGIMGDTNDRGISCSSINVKRASSNLGITTRPPMPPHRSSTITNQTPLFA
ncbi:uncharacterized protein LOC114726374 [Neltuma alba]|uniref:uncharacterized protein LOC114726374 n=1 Tax=Neltuma alba TaxID=207710 RepID=UPI0010A407D5|nr:uncharacterized protein LOC114726374 [Prosopis alba]